MSDETRTQAIQRLTAEARELTRRLKAASERAGRMAVHARHARYDGNHATAASIDLDTTIYANRVEELQQQLHLVFEAIDLNARKMADA